MASIHTFADYLNATYYNEIFKEVDEYVQEYPGKMGGDSGIDYPDEASVLDVHVRSTGVDDAPGDGISFLAVVEADLEVVSISHHYRDSQGSSMWFKVQCTATLHNGLQNFSVQDVSIYSEYDRKRHDVLSDTLVPIIYSVELEKIATDFVRRYYPEALLTPMPIIPEELARRMGLHIEEVHLSKTCTVFGMTCFKKGIVEVYDQELKRYKDIKVEENTILVDPDIYFMRSLGCKNNTVVHECVHWDKHKKFFELQKLFNPEAAAIRCQVSETNNCIVLDPFLGSGSTLIACEQTGRICYGIELDEKFVDVIVNRYIEQRGSAEDVSVIRNNMKISYQQLGEEGGYNETNDLP